MTTYNEAKEIVAAANKACDEASAVLVAAKGGSCLGLTPDSVKATPEYQAALKAYNVSFAQLRNTNVWFTKAFKKEYAAERKAKYASMMLAA